MASDLPLTDDERVDLLCSAYLAGSAGVRDDRDPEARVYRACLERGADLADLRAKVRALATQTQDHADRLFEAAEDVARQPETINRDRVAGRYAAKGETVALMARRLRALLDEDTGGTAPREEGS